MQIEQTSRKRKRLRYKLNKKIKRAEILDVSIGASFDTSQGYHVYGEREHFVVINNGSVSCDCGNASGPCSHVIAVRMFRGDWDAKTNSNNM